MHADQYDNPLSTASADARDAYDRGLYRLLAAQAGSAAAFADAIAHDPGFALAHAGLARAHQMAGDMPAARAAMTDARTHAPNLRTGSTGREASHLNALGLLIDGKPGAYAAIRAHVAEHPRDALVAQTCSSVFGLIGFSGQPGREAEMLAYSATLLPHYGEDWWCLSQYAFGLCETGNLSAASEVIDRSLALEPANANGAHVRSHIWYEAGDRTSGLAYLDGWVADYDRAAPLHGHLAWHVALWQLEAGEIARMWQTVEASVVPGRALGAPINVLTDTASILWRAALTGVEVPRARWQAVSRYAAETFPKTGNAFIDTHAALAHAMAGDADALAAIVAHPAGPAADLVPDLARAMGALAEADWSAARDLLTRAMADHARIGGSRAQRDLLEHTLAACLRREGQAEEANRLLALRRPILAAHADPALA